MGNVVVIQEVAKETSTQTIVVYLKKEHTFRAIVPEMNLE